MHSASIMPLAIRHLDGWRIRTPHGTALVARQGAQLLSYTPAGEPPLVWLSERAHFTPGRPMRGGVPVCWPWFAAYARNPPAVRDSVGAPADAPSHGWVRQADWHLVAQRVEADAAELELGFDAPPGCAPGWRHDARLVLRIRCDRELSLALSVHNRGAQACTTALALHTYLAVSDSRQVAIDGLQGHDYLDMAQGWTRRRQHGPVRLDGETDRLYLATGAPVLVRDHGWGRNIRVASGASRSTVVWNPGPAKAGRLDDLADDAWPRMLCVETARALDDALTLAPGQRATVSVALSTQRVPAGPPGIRKPS